MSFFARMQRLVGDADPVWRYLLEKVGHVSILTLWLSHLPFPTWIMALFAALVYDIVGKVIWYVQHHTFDGVDMLFDFMVCLLPAIIVAPFTEGWSVCAFFIWCLFIAIGSNNQWGSPS